jgi:hypothetical protein
MKKLIAISVMCALVTGAAFAETSVGGQVFVGGTILQGDNIKDSQPTTGGIENDRYNTAIKVSFSEGSAGGRIRILGNNAGASDIFDEWFGWWRPIPQLRIQVGSNQDGDFGTAQISGWGFTGENKNNGGNQGAMGEYNGYQEGRNVARTVGWYGGTGGTPNLQFSLYPIDGLSVNVWIPWSSQEVGFTLARFNAQVQYRLTDIGTVSLSYQGDTGYLKADPDSWWKTEQTGMPKIFASFYLTAIDGMGVDLGLAYKFPLYNERTEATTNYPFEVGLGYRFGQGDFGFKLRASLSTGASVKAKDADAVQDITQISVNILPSYKIGTATVFFYAGMGVLSNPEYEEGDDSQYGINESNSIVSWFVNPYVFIPAGGLRFKVGFQLYSDGNKYMKADGSGDRDDPVIKWAIPFGFYAYF